jgi:hypothetical protein
VSRRRLRVLSLGAGVQSSTVLLLAAEGRIPAFDVALFADTGWEARRTYSHLAELTEHAQRAGIAVRRVSAGHIRRDALDPGQRFVSMPLFVLGPGEEHGMARRQCTGEYKLKPVKAEVRRLLGYPHPARVPDGVHAEMAIGISADEVHRARDADVRYMRNVFPLLDLGWTRDDCRTYLAGRGFTDVPRSACLGCPFHGNARWRAIRDGDPDEWADVVAFDAAIRHGHPRATAGGQELRGTYYLHHSRQPLAEADLDSMRVPRRPRAGAALDPAEAGDPDGCSPWTCRSGLPVTGTDESDSGPGRAA